MSTPPLHPDGWRKTTGRAGARGTRDGFTLLEILIVISILGVLVTLTGLKLDGVTSSARLRSSARRVGSTIQYMQSQSIVQGRYYYIQYDLEENRYRIVIAPEYAREGMDLEGLVKQQYWRPLLEGVEFEDITFDDGVVVEEDLIDVPFTPTGMKWGFLLHLINENGRRFTVEANALTGLVRYYPYYKELDEVPEELF